MECQKEVSNAGLAKIVTPEQDSVIAQMAETNKDVLIGIRFDPFTGVCDFIESGHNVLARRNTVQLKRIYFVQ